MFHFIGENLWLTVASPESMQFLKETNFDKGKLSVMEPTFVFDSVYSMLLNFVLNHVL